jgi:hypothetical protein
MNAETAGKTGRTALLYIGLIVAVVYCLLLAIAPFMALRLYRLNAKLTERIVVLEAKAAAAPARQVETQTAPVILNFYGTAELVPRGERTKHKNR